MPCQLHLHGHRAFGAVAAWCCLALLAPSLRQIHPRRCYCCHMLVTGALHLHRTAGVADDQQLAAAVIVWHHCYLQHLGHELQQLQVLLQMLLVLLVAPSLQADSNTTVST